MAPRSTWKRAAIVVLALSATACGLGAPALTTYDMLGCYTMGVDGRLEMGGPTGSQIVIPGDGTTIGGLAEPGVEHAVPILWPTGVTARLEGMSTVIVGSRGNVIARAGEQTSLGGGYGEGGFWACD